MASKTLEDLLHDQLQDAYSAETQIAKALPKMAKAATSPQLKAAFEAHLEETKNQATRLEQACKMVNCKTSGNTCEATTGLIKEGEEVIGGGYESGAMDVGLIGAAQKVEHYEIALYGTICAIAKQLGRNDVATLLHASLEEEKATNENLTKLAESGVNAAAAKH